MKIAIEKKVKKSSNSVSCPDSFDIAKVEGAYSLS